MTKNITLALDEALLDQARVYAARRGTTVTALVRDYLVQVATSDDRVARARSDIKTMSGRDDFAVGNKDWRRDDLHDR